MDWGIVASVLVALALFAAGVSHPGINDDRPVRVAHEEACRQPGWRGL